MKKGIKDYTELFATYQRIRSGKEHQEYVLLLSERKGKGKLNGKKG